MSTVGESRDTPERAQVYDHGFQAPRRRQKALSVVTVVVLGAVCFLVFLMARGPDPDATAQRIADAALSALPEGDLGEADLRAAATEFQRALDTSPDNGYVLEAVDSLQRRVTGEVGAAIERGELERADAMLTAAGESWPGSDSFGATGELRAALEGALLQRRIGEEVAELIAAAQQAMNEGAADGDRIEDIGAALEPLRRALELDPANDRAQSLRDDVRLDVVAATRRELDAGNPDGAQELLNVAGVEWSGDDAIAELRDELGRLLDRLASTAELRRLVDLGERRLASDNLTTPAGDSAVDHFRRALALDAGSEQAAAGLARVAERYALLVRDAVERSDTAQARRLLSRLADVAPQHPEVEPLTARIEAAEGAARAALDRQTAVVAAPAEPPVAPSSTGPVIADDEEGRLWSAVMNDCDEAQLRRYIDAYPAGRYIEEAWRRRSACLEAR